MLIHYKLMFNFYYYTQVEENLWDCLGCQVITHHRRGCPIQSLLQGMEPSSSRIRMYTVQYVYWLESSFERRLSADRLTFVYSTVFPRVSRCPTLFPPFKTFIFTKKWRKEQSLKKKHTHTQVSGSIKICTHSSIQQCICSFPRVSPFVRLIPIPLNK